MYGFCSVLIDNYECKKIIMDMPRKYRKYVYWFDSRDRHEELKAKSIKGGISTTGSQFFSFGLNLISTFILARLLLPADFGLVGMVTAFTGFANIIKEMGLSMAVIQKENITHGQVSNLFWINVLICFFIGLLFSLLSPLIVALYHHDTRIYPIIFSYSIGIFISGFSIQHNALMTRKMLFTDLAKVNIFSTFLSVCCGIAAGLLGLGYWAIVILNFSLILFSTCFLWILCDWRPSLPSKNQKIKDFLKFGAGLSGSNMISYFSRNSDDIIIGRMLGPTSVGFYSKAYQLLMLPINQLRSPLTAVAIPALSALRNNAVKFSNYYKKYIFILAYFSMPLVVCLGIFSKEIILLVLGSQWVESSYIFQILAFAAFILPVANSRGMILISTGRTKKLFTLVLIITAATVGGFFIGIYWGITGIALSLVITTYLLLIPTLFFTFKGTPLRVSDFFNEISLPIVHTLLMSGFIILIKIGLGVFLSDIFIFIVIAPISVVFYYFSWKVYHKGRTKSSDIDDLIHLVIQKVTKHSFHLTRALESIS